MAIKFCCKFDFSATKTAELIQKAYGDAALGRTTIFEWHDRLRGGRESVKDDERSGRPTTSQTDDNIAAVVDKMIKEYYKGVLDSLISGIRRVRPSLYRTRDFFLLHDDVPAHSAAIIRQFLTQKQVAILNHSPHTRQICLPPTPEGEVADEGCKTLYN